VVTVMCCSYLYPEFCRGLQSKYIYPSERGTNTSHKESDKIFRAYFIEKKYIVLCAT